MSRHGWDSAPPPPPVAAASGCRNGRHRFTWYKSPSLALRHLPAPAEADEVLLAGSGPTRDLIHPAFLPPCSTHAGAGRADVQQCFGITSACEPGPLTWRARCERRFSVARLSLCLSHPPPPPTPPHPPPLTHTKATCASPPKPTHSPKQGSLSIPLVHTNNTESCHTHMHTELHVSCVARKSFPYHLLSFSHKCDLTRRLSRPQEQT